MRHLFIINPAAGKKESTARLERLLAELSFDHEVATLWKKETPSASPGRRPTPGRASGSTPAAATAP